MSNIVSNIDVNVAYEKIQQATTALRGLENAFKNVVSEENNVTAGANKATTGISKFTEKALQINQVLGVLKKAKGAFDDIVDAAEKTINKIVELADLTSKEIRIDELFKTKGTQFAAGATIGDNALIIKGASAIYKEARNSLLGLGYSFEQANASITNLSRAVKNPFELQKFVKGFADLRAAANLTPAEQTNFTRIVGESLKRGVIDRRMLRTLARDDVESVESILGRYSGLSGAALDNLVKKFVRGGHGSKATFIEDVQGFYDAVFEGVKGKSQELFKLDPGAQIEAIENKLTLAAIEFGKHFFGAADISQFMDRIDSIVKDPEFGHIAEILGKGFSEALELAVGFAERLIKDFHDSNVSVQDIQNIIDAANLALGLMLQICELIASTVLNIAHNFDNVQTAASEAAKGAGDIANSATAISQNRGQQTVLGLLATAGFTPAETIRAQLPGHVAGGVVTGIHAGIATVSAAPDEGLVSIGRGEQIVPAGSSVDMTSFGATYNSNYSVHVEVPQNSPITPDSIADATVHALQVYESNKLRQRLSRV